MSQLKSPVPTKVQRAAPGAGGPSSSKLTSVGSPTPSHDGSVSSRSNAAAASKSTGSKASRSLSIDPAAPPSNRFGLPNSDPYIAQTTADFSSLRANSTPKRQFALEHTRVQDNIRRIINNFDDYSEDADRKLGSNTSKYTLDSVFEDFETMAKNANTTLINVYHDMQGSLTKGEELAQMMEKAMEDEFGGQDGVVAISDKAKDFLADGLSKINHAIRHNKSLSQDELVQMQRQMQGTLDMVQRLEASMQRGDERRALKEKEFEMYKIQTAASMAAMQQSLESQRDDLFEKYRTTAEEKDDLERKVKELKKLVDSGITAGRRGSSSPIDLNAAMAASAAQAFAASNALAAGGKAQGPQTPTSAADQKRLLQYEFEIKDLKAKVDEGTRTIVELKRDIEQQKKMEQQMMLKASQVKKSGVDFEGQTELKKWGKLKAGQSGVDYLETWMADNEAGDDNVRTVIAEFKKKEGDLAKAVKTISDLERDKRVADKKLEQATRSAEEALARAKAAEQEVKVAGNISADKNRAVLEQSLKEAASEASALKTSKEKVDEMLRSMIKEVGDLKDALRAEKTKSEGLQGIVDEKVKALENALSELRRQKEAFDALNDETNDQLDDDKAKYLTLMAKLNEQMEEVGRREAALGEREVLLDVKRREVENRERVAEEKSGAFDVAAKDLEERKALMDVLSSAVEERERLASSKEAQIEQAATANSFDTSAMEEELATLKKALAELVGTIDAITAVSEKKSELIHLEADVDHETENLSKKREKLAELENILAEREKDHISNEESLSFAERRLTDRRARIREMESEVEASEMELSARRLQRESMASAAPLKPTTPVYGGSATVFTGGHTDEEVMALEAVIAEQKVEIEQLKENIAMQSKRGFELESFMKETQRQLETASAAAQARPGTSSAELRELRGKVSDYEAQMANTATLRESLTALELDLQMREAAFAERTSRIEKHLSTELERVKQLAIAVSADAEGAAGGGKEGKSGVSLGEVSIDWYNPNFGNEEQFSMLLQMVENWVSGNRMKLYVREAEGGIAVKANKGNTFDVTLSQKQIPPLQAIVELHKSALDKITVKRLQHVILQAEKFGGDLTPSSVKDSLLQSCREISLSAKSMVRPLAEVEAATLDMEKNLIVSAKQPNVNWGQFRKAVLKWAETLELSGQLSGMQFALANSVNELQKFQTGFLSVVEKDCNERAIASLFLSDLSTPFDELVKTSTKSQQQLDSLQKRKDAIDKTIADFAMSYERDFGTNAGAELMSTFAERAARGGGGSNRDLMSIEEGKALVAEVMALRARLEEVEGELEQLKSDKYNSLLAADGSYGGLMFFAFLQEDHFEEKLGAVIDDMTDLYETCHGQSKSGHVSHSELRKKIDHLSKLRMPLLRKLQGRYGKLHKKWQSERLRRMKDMKLSGGEADNSAICPICNVDSRNVKDVGTNSKLMKGGSAASVPYSKKVEKQVEQVATVSTVMNMAHKWKRLTAIHHPNGAEVAPPDVGDGVGPENAPPAPKNVTPFSALLAAKRNGGAMPQTSNPVKSDKEGVGADGPLQKGLTVATGLFGEKEVGGGGTDQVIAARDIRSAGGVGGGEGRKAARAPEGRARAASEDRIVAEDAGDAEVRAIQKGAGRDARRSKPLEPAPSTAGKAGKEFTVLTPAKKAANDTNDRESPTAWGEGGWDTKTISGDDLFVLGGDAVGGLKLPRI